MTWNYAYTPYLWPSIGTALFLLALSVFSWRRRGVPGAIPFLIGCLFAAAWSAGSLMEYAAVDLVTKIDWSKYQSCVEASIVIAVTCFILEYAWPGRWLTRRNLILQGIIPVVWLALALTNDFHHLAWSGFHYNGSGLIQQQMGQGAWVLIFSVLPIYAGINLIVFIWLFLRSPQHRWPIILMLVGQFTGRTIYILVKAEVLRFVLPLELLGMGFEFLTYAIALFGFHIFDPIPLARQTAIEQLHSGMLVLDWRGKIASLNPAAARILGVPAKAATGKPICDLLPAFLPGFLDGPVETEIRLGTAQAMRHYSLEVSRLDDWRGMEVGHLVMLRDITEQKQVQAQILEQQRALATLQEREHLARELHDGIGQVLGYVKMQAQASRDRLAQGQTAEVDGQLAQLITVAQDAHADVREYILGAKTAANTAASGADSGQGGFLAGIRQYLKRFSEVYELRAELIEPPGWRDDLLGPTVEAQLLRIIQEALTNARKHARAACVQVSFRLNGARVQVTIQDDGIGFDPALVQDGIGQSYGLGFLRERAAQVGGSVAILSAPGQGTRVVVDVPRRSRPRRS
jgi:PAS domain S-box-containing protein